MTTVPTGEAPGAAGSGSGAADLQVDKLLSRDFDEQAQALLVVVSTSAPALAGEDVWVAIGWDRPVVLRESGAWARMESARALTRAELDALDPDRADGSTPFELTIDPQRSYWLARFEFSDHPQVGEWWQWVYAGKDLQPPRAFPVLAWRSRLNDSTDAEEAAPAAFAPLPGHALASVTMAEVVMQAPFDLGVLLVHGIGDHGVRETLVRWAEPIVDFWRRRAEAISAEARRAIDPEQRAQLKRWTEGHPLRGRMPLDGISQVVTQLASLPDADARPPLVPPRAAAPRQVGAAIKAEQTVFPDLNPGLPSATVVRVSAIDENATLREAHVLFAEAAWTREAFPPTSAELYTWLTDAIPIAVWARIHRLSWIRPREILRFARAARRRGSALELLRVGISALLWVLQMLMMPAIYVVLALVGQMVIALVGTIGLLPIPWLRRATRWVVGALIGTVGQSYALQTSAVRRSAIVSAVTRNLDWLSQRCQRVVVLSHSQGAEISRLAFVEARRDKIARWYTVGAGIAPLSMLRPDSLERWGSKAVIAVAKLALLASVLLLIALALDTVPGIDLGIRDGLLRALRGIRWQGALGAYIVLLVALIVLRPLPPVVDPMLRRSLMAKWRDIYASEDPVPGGSLIDLFAADLRQQKIPVPVQRRIFNTRFALLDHTAYFRNIEQFIAPIALDLLRLAGVGSGERFERRALRAAARRRDCRTWWALLFSVTTLAAAAASFFFIAFGPPGRGALWLDHGRRIWRQGGDLWDRLGRAWSDGFFGTLIVDLRLPLALLVALGAGWYLAHRLTLRSEETLVQDLGRAGKGAPPSP